ncbi:hypothetical protein VTI74DRAFT_4267 [Chaetomium olivicolor]
MHLSITLRGFAALTAAGGVSARFLPDSPPATRLHPLLAARQETKTASRPRSTLSPDPWQCVTENITQCFDVPMPTGTLFDAINSYASEQVAPCHATASGPGMVSCIESYPVSWCGFTTAVPSEVLSDYLTYASEAVSFRAAKSDSISVLSTSCPVAWKRYSPADHYWLRFVSGHANCYLEAHHLATGTSTAAPTPMAGDVNPSTTGTASTATSLAATTTRTSMSGASILRCGQAVAASALMIFGLTVLANAA